jgi:hypothetical protein
MPVSFAALTVRDRTVCRGRPDMPTTSAAEMLERRLGSTACTGRTAREATVPVGEAIQRIGPCCLVPSGPSILSPYAGRGWLSVNPSQRYTMWPALHVRGIDSSKTSAPSIGAN